MTTKLLEQLKPHATGVEKVPMKVHFSKFTLNVISKVILCMTYSLSQARINHFRLYNRLVLGLYLTKRKLKILKRN